MSKFANRSVGFLGVAVALWVAGCASEQPPRSYVQPNIIKKTDLTGTDPASTPVWHYLQTIIDAPPTNGTAFMGQSSSLMNIRFKITEDYLYALRSFEHVEGTEDNWWRDPAHYEGQPLAAWKISSHFDIIRDYNSTTGEQTNKIIESTERNWQDREFMRVDWSQNEVTDYVGIGLDFIFSDGQPDIQNVSYWESDPTKPDAIHFDRAAADNTDDGFKQGEAVYFDITNMLIVTPDQLTARYQEGGRWYSFTYPRCFFYYFQDDCASQKIKVRHAFAKVGPSHQYVPRDWDGLQMNLFGVWDVGLRRLTYNRQYGITNTGFKRHAARFNIWKNSLTTGADGSTTPLPYWQRTVRQIPYYAEGSQSTPVDQGGGAIAVESRFPEELYPSFKEVINQWNQAQKVMLASLVHKIDDQGTDMGPVYASDKDAPDVFIPCHSPVKMKATGSGPNDGADDPRCVADLLPDTGADGNPKLDKNGDKIYRPRQGDPRRSNVFWVNEQQNAGPLGYGPPIFDEETGETISGQAYIYGAALDTYAARSRDLILLQNGEVSNTDYIGGANVQALVAKNRIGTLQKPQTFEPKQVAQMAAAMDFDFARGFGPEMGLLDTSSNRALYQSLADREDRIFKGFFEQQSQVSMRDQNIGRLIGTPIEKMMIGTENIALGGVSPLTHWEQMAPIEQAMVSPIRQDMMNANALQERLKAERLGVDFENFDDAGLGQRLRKYLNDTAWCPSGPNNCMLSARAEDLRQSMRAEIFLGVTLHEVGHNMGCRHNFRASYDAMNYFPDYWQIRTDALSNGDVGMIKNPDGKLHARYLNMPGGAVTQYELDKGVREYQYSSIMDYGAEFNSDLKGLGLYDKALIKFSYGELLEVFTKTDPMAGATIGALHAGQNSYGFPTALASSGLAAIPYFTYPDLFADGDWHHIYDRADVPRSTVMTQTLDTNGNTIIADAEGRPMVPYYFCSDEFAGNLTCQRFDAGPDPYEQATDIISRYENFYLYNNFKRDRQSFHSSGGYLSRIKSRYFEMLRQQLTWYVLLRADFENFEVANCLIPGGNNCDSHSAAAHTFMASEKGWGGFTLGVALGFDTIAKVLTTPSMGMFYHGHDDVGNVLWKQWDPNLRYGENFPPSIQRIDFLDGKWVDTIWDYKGCGYYWSEECQMRIGYMIDKQIALDVLSESQAYFTGRDTNTDVRQYAIGYIVPFKSQIEEKFGAIFASDTNSLAPVFRSDLQGNVVTANRSWVFDNPAEFPTRPNISPNNERIDPSTGFTVQLYAGVYGLAAFPTTFDHDFIDHTQIFVVGNGEASYPDSLILQQGVNDPKLLVGNGGNKEWFVYQDPENGKMYAAHSVPPRVTTIADPVNGSSGSSFDTNSVPLRLDSGVRMLERLKALGDVLVAAQAVPMGDPDRDARIAASRNNYDLFKENVEIMRSLHNAFGYGQYKTDAPFYL
jgi:hypothetical protein